MTTTTTKTISNNTEQHGQHYQQKQLLKKGYRAKKLKKENFLTCIADLANQTTYQESNPVCFL